jgi:pimeloyl-ACP methyl ester carboxylesterase
MNNVALPVTRYALSGDVSIAYQVMGDGPIDLVMVPGAVSHVECRFLRRLSTFARVINFDKRAQGLGGRISAAASLEERMDDVRAVMDAAGSKRAV